MFRHIFFIFFVLIINHQVFPQTISAKYDLLSIGRKVNSQYHEGAPAISPDGKTLYFFVTNHPDNTYGREGSQDIWYSKLDGNGVWGDAQHLKRPLNNHRSNEVFTVFSDGNSLLIRGGKSKNSKGFSFSYKKGGEWGNPVELKIEGLKKMNVGRFYGGTMSSDKKVLIIYMSEKEHSIWSDLYVSFVQDDGTWTRPKKIGLPLNTSRDEFGPSLTVDDKTMYFASTRKDKGLGKSDVYKTTRLDNSWMKWSEPENVGPPVNTPDFDAYFTIDEKGNVFTTKAKRLIDGGNLDIFGLVPKKINITLAGMVMDANTQDPIDATIKYKVGDEEKTVYTNRGGGNYETKITINDKYNFDVTAGGYIGISDQLDLSEVYGDTTILKDFYLKHERIKPIISGTVYDANTNNPIDAEVKYAYKGQGAKGRKNTEDGYFEFEVPGKGAYLLTASAEGYLNTSETLDISNRKDPVMAEKDLYLKPIEIGATVRLNNIFFDFGKTSLKRQSYTELDHVVEFLEDNATVQIEIAGHTDNKGSDTFNEKLSQGRADAVMNYLLSEGIADDRIISKGYGESSPVATNETEKGRATNRRVEFAILSK